MSKVLMIDQIAKVNYKYSFSLCNQLNNLSLDLSIITDKISNCNEINVPFEPYFNTTEASGKLIKTCNYINSWSKILKKIGNEHIDIIHIQWFILSPVDYYFLKQIKKLGTKVIVTIHDILPFNQKFYDYKYHKKIYGLADKIIVQAKINIEKFNKKFREYSNKVIYIPHGNFIDYINVHDKKEAREYLNLPKDKNILLFFGQIKKVKGLDILIRALREVINRNENVLLLIAGKVWEDSFDNYQKIIDELKLEKYIRSDIKYIPDEEIGYYFSAADINVLPYINVYQSGVVQLAYAYKKAVIATKVGGFTEVVLDHKTGLLVEPNNVKDLSNAILELIGDEPKIIEMGRKGNEYIKENYSWKDIAEKISKQYEEVLNK